MLNPCRGEIHCLGEETAQSFPQKDLLSQRCYSLGRQGQLQDSLGSLNPKRRSVQRVGAALLALGGKRQAGRPFRPPLSTALDR